MTNNIRKEAQARRRDLQRFITVRKIKVAPWAKAAGVSEGTIRNFLTKRSATLTQATVDALVAAIGVPAAVIFPSSEKMQTRKGTMAAPTFMADGRGGSGAKDLPIIPLAKAGGGQRLNHARASRLTERPEYLARVKTAYALEIIDATMSPAFERGWLVYVDPTETAKVGDNVVATFTDGASLVRRLVRKSKAGVTLRQFNPRKDSETKAASLASLHVIAGVRYRK
jgi:SOS-response transcriptional repressor LexA